MRILIHSPAFLPLVGGLEINTAVIARGLVKLGDEVAVITRTAGTDEEAEPYFVIRNPSPAEFLRWSRWCDVVLHQNLSLRGYWPLLFIPRPLVVAHHSWYRRVSGRAGVRDLVKRAMVRRAAGSIAVSEAIAAELGRSTVVVENGYRDDLFFPKPGMARDRDVLFVGRLVSDKGIDLLLTALALLRSRGLNPNLTVVGAGPERIPAERQVAELGLTDQVTFAGVLAGEDLADAYRRHTLLVVPSRYEEPYGIVALEGIACGCVVIGSAGGGLPQAIGPCGVTFPNGDVQALAGCIERLLKSPGERAALRAGAATHAGERAQRRMAERYRAVLVSATKQGNFEG